MLVFSTFFLLTVLTLRVSRIRARSFRRKTSEWGVDGFGLFFQGIGIPLLQGLVILFLFSRIFPGLRKSLMMPGIVAFSINFFLVDYLYYWNHRLLHHPILWSTHSVHHSGEVVDVWTTSRNVFWAPLLIIYLWINAFFIYVLKDPGWFLISVALTASLDLWRHSNFGPLPGTRAHFIL